MNGGSEKEVYGFVCACVFLCAHLFLCLNKGGEECMWECMYVFENKLEDGMFFPLKSYGLLKIQLIPITEISLTRERSILQRNMCNDSCVIQDYRLGVGY